MLFVVGDALPRLDFLTKIDKMIAGSISLMVITVVVAVAAGVVQTQQQANMSPGLNGHR